MFECSTCSVPGCDLDTGYITALEREHGIVLCDKNDETSHFLRLTVAEKAGVADEWVMHNVRGDSIYVTVLPILQRTYGEGSMVTALAGHLEVEIEKWNAAYPLVSRDRQFTIMNICWNWFGGGGTADSVSTKIDKALG